MQHALPPSAEGSSGKVKRRSGPRSRSSPYKGKQKPKKRFSASFSAELRRTRCKHECLPVVTSPAGVTQYKRTGRWEAHIWVSNPRGRGYQRHLGSYLTAEDAARAFDRATIRLRGMDDELNFAKEDYIHDAFMLVQSNYPNPHILLNACYKNAQIARKAGFLQPQTRNLRFYVFFCFSSGAWKGGASPFSGHSARPFRHPQRSGATSATHQAPSHPALFRRHVRRR